jgi:hypothetical protein
MVTIKRRNADMHAVEVSASVSPQAGISLSDQVQKRIQALAETLGSDAAVSTNQARKEIQALAKQLVADVGAAYEAGLTTQCALLTVEVRELRAENEALRRKR